ncbi:jg6991 [Pararge aegeria aegeria]|uniref:Jg6991 protein n=1 Tax=Pararge aegeria aegeria TaxID=348720 RepID=A0A8S4S935_9NEOP|nr:jg6991 [Pararge aegeria aegeria]
MSQLVSFAYSLDTVINTKAMWSRKQSVCSAVSGTSKGDEQDAHLPLGQRIYPFATALRVRVLQSNSSQVMEGTFPTKCHLSYKYHASERNPAMVCSSRTCIGVAAAQLTVSLSTLAAACFMVQVDFRFDAALSPPRPSDANICTAVSMVPLTSVAINSGNSGDGGPEGSPLSKEKNQPPDPPT